MGIDGLPSLKDVIACYRLQPRHSLGQNFLLDLNLTSSIARVAGDLSNTTIIEVGAGPGGLTRALLMHGAKKIIAIECDERCFGALEQISNHYKGRVELIRANVLDLDFHNLVKDDPVKIIANLPYNIGTHLLIRWLSVTPWPPWYSSMTLMFQKEVAQRIVASPGDKAYGRLSVLAGWRTRACIVFDVDRKAFTPPPLVTSSIVHFIPRENPLPVIFEKLELVTKTAFGQRRKMLRQSLKPLGGRNLLEKAHIDETSRAENLNIEDFINLSNLI